MKSLEFIAVEGIPLIKEGDNLVGVILLALEKNNIPFEIIPGVSSAIAAAAAAKIPLTRRLHSRRLQFITGHDFNGNLPDDLHISSLTDSSSTTVIFMGKKTLAQQMKRSGLASKK